MKNEEQEYLDAMAIYASVSPWIEILGNHESYDALEPLHYSQGRVILASRAVIEHRMPDVTCLAIPYPRLGRPPFHDLEGDLLSRRQQASSRINQWVQAARRDALDRGSTPLIVFGHWTVEGMTTGGGMEIHNEQEVVVSQRQLASASLVVVGHIHRAQAIPGTLPPFSLMRRDDPLHPQQDAPIVGVGSLYRCAFDEASDEKTWLLIEVLGGEPRCERYRTIARTMMTVDLAWPLSPAETARVQALATSDAEVKVRVQIREADLPTYDPEAFAVLEALPRHVIERDVLREAVPRPTEVQPLAPLRTQVDRWLTEHHPQLELVRHERIVGFAETVERETT